MTVLKSVDNIAINERVCHPACQRIRWRFELITNFARNLYEHASWFLTFDAFRIIIKVTIIINAAHHHQLATVTVKWTSLNGMKTDRLITEITRTGTHSMRRVAAMVAVRIGIRKSGGIFISTEMEMFRERISAMTCMIEDEKEGETTALSPMPCWIISLDYIEGLSTE